MTQLRCKSSGASLKSILLPTDRDLLKLLSTESGRGRDRFLGRTVGEKCWMERLVRTGDEGLATGMSLGALSFLLDDVFLIFLTLLLGAMLEGDNVHLTEKKKGKMGERKNVKLRRRIHNSEPLRRVVL